MGRKTWDSIPSKFRPLKDRLNIVLSRSYPSSASSSRSSSESTDGPVQLSSISAALAFLSQSRDPKIGKVFVIGGGEIYQSALDLPETKRILLTRILSDFDCDTFLKVDLESGWRKGDTSTLVSWTGESEEKVAGEQEENGTKYLFEVYERS